MSTDERSTGLRLHRRALGTLALFSPRFGHWVQAPVPMQTLLHPTTAQSSARAKDLFIFLPGIQDLHHQFELAGFTAEARRHALGADMLAVDAHIGYYVRNVILERIREDVILPAKREGYEKIWLVGVSLGGLGAALYAGQFESDINGLFLLAPFLGERSLVQKIKRSGGPSLWKPARGVPRFKIELWRWLELYFSEPDRRPPLYLGFGEQDKFAFTNRFLAEMLPPDRVLRTSGGHDWRTWRKLWGRFLEIAPTAENELKVDT